MVHLLKFVSVPQISDVPFYLQMQKRSPIWVPALRSTQQREYFQNNVHLLAREFPATRGEGLPGYGGG